MAVVNEDGMEPPVDIDWDGLTFSFKPTDKMYKATCRQGEVWKPGGLLAYGDLTISPAAGVLNYGQGAFEGMKAQRTPDGHVVLFRPERNAARLQAGAVRLGLPPIPTEMFLEAVEAVVAGNARWVPPSGRGSLYLRPLLIGTGPILGVSAAPEYTFLIYCCPVGPYFKGGLKPIALKVSDEHHRACPGGSGGAKAIGNYAPGMEPSRAAKELGFNEIIYLDAVEHRYVEEVGAANFFYLKGKTLRTPMLTGTILPGITRESIIELARSRGYDVIEERVPIEDAMKADEAFCSGTAAVIAPIGRIAHGEECAEFCGGEVGPVTRELYDALTSLQTLRAPDTFGWVRHVKLGKRDSNGVSEEASDPATKPRLS